MEWLHYIACAFGGVFLVNAIPHVVSGVTGRPFQSPFAKPHGVGLSSSTVNVLWGFLNLCLAYLLLVRTARFSIDAGADVAVAGIAALLTGLITARLFGRFHGGNDPAGS